MKDIGYTLGTKLVYMNTFRCCFWLASCTVIHEWSAIQYPYANFWPVSCKLVLVRALYNNNKIWCADLQIGSFCRLWWGNTFSNSKDYKMNLSWSKLAKYVFTSTLWKGTYDALGGWYHLSSEADPVNCDSLSTTHSERLSEIDSSHSPQFVLQHSLNVAAEAAELHQPAASSSSLLANIWLPISPITIGKHG